MSKLFRLLYALVIPAMLLSAAAPALAKGAGSGGKKPIGTIVSFDGTTLTMQATDGSTVSAPVSDDAQIKVAHRGRKGQEKTKKPSNGTEANLVPGASVLRLKMKCGEIVKLRVRAAAPAASTTTTESEVDPSSTGTPVGDSSDPDCETDSTDEEADELASEDASSESEDSDDSEEDEEDVEDDTEDEGEEDPSLLDDVVEELPL